jgi:hypothetical protein
MPPKLSLRSPSFAEFPSTFGMELAAANRISPSAPDSDLKRERNQQANALDRHAGVNEWSKA